MKSPSDGTGRLRYKAIGFDVDDALYDPQSAKRHSSEFALEPILERVPDCDLSVRKMIGTRNQVSEELKGKNERFMCYEVKCGLRR